MKRTQWIWKKTYIHEKRRRNACARGRDGPILCTWMKRDIYIYMKRELEKGPIYDTERPGYMKRDLHTWKETYLYAKRKLEKRPIHDTERPGYMKRDSCVYQKRPMYMKRDLYIYKETFLYVKRELEKRPIYKETDIHKKRPRKETCEYGKRQIYTKRDLEKRPVNMERDRYTQKETSKRDLYMQKETCVYRVYGNRQISVSFIFTTFCIPRRPNALQICEKRLVYIWKETNVYAKRPTYMKRRIYIMRYTTFGRPRRPNALHICEKRLVDIWKETYIYMKRDLHIWKEMYMCMRQRLRRPNALNMCKKQIYIYEKRPRKATCLCKKRPVYTEKDVYTSHTLQTATTQCLAHM